MHMRSPKKQLEVAVLAFVADGKVLLNRRADASSEMWEFIGGGVEKYETGLEAIQREIFEEIGYRPTPSTDNLQFVDEFHFEDDRISAKVHFFTANFPGKEAFSDSDETFTADLELFSIENALTLTLLPITREIFSKGLL